MTLTAAPGRGRPWAAAGSAPLLIGLAAYLFIPLVGRLSVLEAAALLLAIPCCAALAGDAAGRLLLLLGVVWLAGIAAAVGRLSSPAPLAALDAARAVAVVTTTALVWRVLRGGGSTARQRLLVALGIGQMLGMLVSPPAVVADGLWKFGFGQAATLITLVALDRLRAKVGRLIAAVLVPLVSVHLLLGSRGLAVFTGIVLVAAALPARQRAPERRRPWVRVAAIAVGAIGVGLLLQRAYIDLAGSGRLGPTEQYKVAYQTGQFGLLIGGRKDVVFLVAAIAHSPLSGWGAAADVPSDVRLEAARWLTEHGYRIGEYDLGTLVRPDNLNLHSVLFGTWVTAGVLAVPFWLMASVLLWRAMLRALAASRLAESFVLVTAVWHVLLSPLGDTTRGYLAIAIALSLTGAARPVGPPRTADDAGPAHQDAGHRRNDHGLADRGSGRAAERGAGRGAHQREHDARRQDATHPPFVPTRLQPRRDRLGHGYGAGGDRERAYRRHRAELAGAGRDQDEPRRGDHDDTETEQRRAGHQPERPAD